MRIEAKAYRKQLRAHNYHKEQCDMIHDVIDHNIHSTPYYKKFTLILTGKNRKLIDMLQIAFLHQVM